MQSRSMATKNGPSTADFGAEQNLLAQGSAAIAADAAVVAYNAVTGDKVTDRILPNRMADGSGGPGLPEKTGDPAIRGKFARADM